MKAPSILRFLVLMVIVTTGCGIGKKTKVLKAIESPTRQYVGYLLQNDSGGGVFGEISYAVRLGRKDDVMSDQDLFHGISNDQPAPAKIALRWRDDSHLYVFYYKVDIFKFKSQWYAGPESESTSGRGAYVELIPVWVESEDQWRKIKSTNIPIARSDSDE